MDCVGKRVQVWWEQEEEWFAGVITSVVGGTMHIAYGRWRRPAF